MGRNSVWSPAAEIARAEKGYGEIPILLLQALPRARAARRSKSNVSAPRGERRKGEVKQETPAVRSRILPKFTRTVSGF